MRIAVATSDGGVIAKHTGRCDGFVIFELNEGVASRQEYRPNSFTAHGRGECSGKHEHAQSGSTHSHGALIGALTDCDALVSGGLGRRLALDLVSAGIDAYLCTASTAAEGAEQCAAGKLERVDAGHSCQHR